MKKLDSDTIYKKFKHGRTIYDEDIHCRLLIEVMTNKNQGSMSAFCVEAFIGETTFWDWLDNYELFFDIYAFCKMYAREQWEQDGIELKNLCLPPGTTSYALDHWKMMGWSRFGISKNSRIKLKLNPEDNPSQHYKQLLKQAASGEYTASEIKQLMEAVNVGLNTHQVFELQKEIDQLKSDLATMKENTNGNNSFTNKGTA